jgi:hypothetical protein
MMIGRPANFKIISSKSEMIRKRNLILLSAHRKFLNLNAKNSIRDTSNKEKIIVIPASVAGWYNQRPTSL